MDPTTAVVDEDKPYNLQWIELKEPKQFSRLLYTNPVCFLSTTTTNKDEGSNGRSIQKQAMAQREDLGNTCSETKIIDERLSRRNVMVLSWLTATNNSGRFMFSINKRRHTASILFETQENDAIVVRCKDFVLSVPVKGMESLVCNVGQTSGKWGSKFVHEHDNNISTPHGKDETKISRVPISKRQKKKQNRLAHGVPGLEPVRPGGRSDASSQEVKGTGTFKESDSTPLFAVQGTVAHMMCQIYHVIQEKDVIDEDHYLVLAQVTQAFVHPSYWDESKNLFRPHGNVPPYLTFFGSQTFGYTCT